MSAPTEKLKNPSVVEAICEFRFARGISYTMIPGAMRERLRSRFPHFEVLPSAALLGGIPEELMSPPVPHHRFRSQQPNALVQTGPRLLTVNILPVYPGFEVFRELILFVLDNYQAVAEPGNPTRIGLRYINHIGSGPASELGNLNSYLKWSFAYPEELPHPPKETAGRVLLPCGALGTLAMAIAFPARVGESSGYGALLDLDFFWQGEGEFDSSSFASWLDDAHANIYSAFIGSVPEPVMRTMRG